MRNSAILLLCALACGACGGSRAAPPPAAVTPAPAASEQPAEAPKDASLNAEGCVAPKDCTSVGLALKKRGDPTAKIALAKACAGQIRVVEACAALTALYLQDKTTEPEKLADAAEHGCSRNDLDEASDRESRGVACVTFGFSSREGKGVPKDRDKAYRAFKEGCGLGQSRACEGYREVQRELDEERKKTADKEADEASGLPGANLRMNNVSTNGVELELIACKTEGTSPGLGLLGGLVIGKPFADKKKQLDACTKTPHKTRVRWTAKGGKMADVKVTSADDPSNKCIERTMTGALAPVQGTCVATLEIGAAPKKK